MKDWVMVGLVVAGAGMVCYAVAAPGFLFLTIPGSALIGYPLGWWLAWKVR